MFAEGRLLLERVRASLGRKDTPGRQVVDAAIDATTDTARPVAARLAVLQADDLADVFARHPLRDLVTVEGPFPAYADRERALFGSWYEFFPRSEGADQGPETGKVTSRHLPHRRQAPRRGRRDGLRRRLPAADPPDRPGQPQGPEQHPHPRPGRHRLAVGDRLARRAATTPSTPTSAPSRTSTRSSPAPTSSASRSRSTSRCSARPTTPG